MSVSKLKKRRESSEDSVHSTKKRKNNEDVESLEESHHPEEPLSLCDLPPEIIIKILDILDKPEHMSLRSTSKHLRDFSDHYIMKEIERSKRVITKSLSTNAFNYQNEILSGIKTATELYIDAGYQSAFCGSILHILNRSMKTGHLYPNHELSCRFLQHFYKVVEFCNGGPESQQSQLLHNLTLIRLLKENSNRDSITSTKLRSRWVGQIIIAGYYFDNDWAKPIHRKRLLSTVSRKEYCRQLLFGYNHPTSFSFTVIGSDEVCSLFRSCLEDEHDKFVWPTAMPEDPFTFNLDIRRIERFNEWLNADADL